MRYQSIILLNINLFRVTFKDPALNYQWSGTNKHADIKINARIANKPSAGWNMILIDPPFTMTGVTKVTLKISKLEQVKFF